MRAWTILYPVVEAGIYCRWCGDAAVARLGFAWTHRVGIVIRHCGRTNRTICTRDEDLYSTCSLAYLLPQRIIGLRIQPCIPSNVGAWGINSSQFCEIVCLIGSLCWFLESSIYETKKKHQVKSKKHQTPSKCHDIT